MALIEVASATDTMRSVIIVLSIWVEPRRSRGFSGKIGIGTVRPPEAFRFKSGRSGCYPVAPALF